MKFTFSQIKTHFKKQIKLYEALYKDRRTPRTAKIFLWLAIGYALLPIDLIPDFIPVLGHIDDLVIIPLLLWIALRFIPKELINEHKENIL